VFRFQKESNEKESFEEKVDLAVANGDAVGTSHKDAVMDSIKILGHRRKGRADLRSSDGFLRLVLRLRGDKPFIPKGIHRFTSFEESFQWSIRMMGRSSNQGRRR